MHNSCAALFSLLHSPCFHHGGRQSRPQTPAQLARSLLVCMRAGWQGGSFVCARQCSIACTVLCSSSPFHSLGLCVRLRRSLAGASKEGEGAKASSLKQQTHGAKQQRSHTSGSSRKETMRRGKGGSNLVALSLLVPSTVGPPTPSASLASVLRGRPSFLFVQATAADRSKAGMKQLQAWYE